MNHFKHLTFYLGAIASVVILFTLVTSYGEANLKGSTIVEGIYKIESQLDCQNNSLPLQLIIHQSGIYINSALVPVEENIKIKPKIQVSELSGKLQQNQLFLSGKSNICGAIAIDASLTDGTLTGKVFANSMSIDFLAQKIKTEESKLKSH